MKTYHLLTRMVALTIALAGGALPPIVNAEPLLQVRHQIIGLEQADVIERGHIQIEILNLGADALADVSLRLEGSSGVQVDPMQLVVGNLEPAEVRILNVLFRQVPGNGEQAPVTWRIGYLDAEGHRQQALVPGNGGGDMKAVGSEGGN